MSEPSRTGPTRGDDSVDDRRTDQDRDVSDVGLPQGGDGGRTDDAGDALGGPDVDVDGGPVAEDAGLDEAFPPADRA